MFLSKLKIYIFWSIVDLECYVSFYCTRTSESVIHTLIYIPSFQPFLSIYIYIGHYRVEKSSLCYRKGPWACACPVAQSYRTLCKPMDCIPLGSSVHGILQARLLEWVAMPASGDFQTQGSNLNLLCLLHWQLGSSPLAPPGKPRKGPY